MLQNCRHVPATRFALPSRRLASLRRTYRTKKGSEPATKKIPSTTAPIITKQVRSTPTAQRLADAGIWKPSGRGRHSNIVHDRFNLPIVDQRRVNIVSDSLCDDVIQRLGPSLERHRGCDLIDLNPGVGLWSRALHDVIQPRRHIMMDADADSYRPFLDDFIRERKGVHVIPKSGLVWSNLTEMMAEHLDQSHPHRPTEPNDTLLVTANISTFPKRAAFSFDNVATMILYQFINSIQSSTLFQRYGLVRMLIWVNDENKRRILPRSVGMRKRSAFEAELSCEWIHEVAGHDDPTAFRSSVRDEWLSLESAAAAAIRMAEQGITTPVGRESRILAAVNSDPSLLRQQLAGRRPPNLQRPFAKELESAEASDTEAQDSEKLVRLRLLRGRKKFEAANAAVYLELLQQQEAVLAMDPTCPEFVAADLAFHNRIENLKKNAKNEFLQIRDEYHLFRHQKAPAMHWDRRPYEPLVVDEREFYPNAPCTLLDIQPKAMDPLLREIGPGTSRAGDMSTIMLRSMFHSTLQQIYPKGLDAVWPGFADMAHPSKGLCPSLRDPRLGGSTMSGYGELLIRAINEQQWRELIAAWMQWPFRPGYNQMIGRFVDEDGSFETIDTEGVKRPGGLGIGGV